MLDYKPKIGIIDFKSTNLYSISKALSKFGKVKKINFPKHIKNVDILVIPGVGTFSNGMKYLKKKKLVNQIINHAKARKKVIGICLGMQLLMQSGTETKKTNGISLFNGKVYKFNKNNINIGWRKNIFLHKENKRFFKNSFFYFVHSYFCKVEDKYVYAYSEFKGKMFPSVIKNKNIIGIQFHPEKSSISGLNFLKKIIFEA